MKVKGIKRGHTIELVEPLEFIPHGTEITIEVTVEISDEIVPPITSFIGTAKGSFATPEEVDQFIRQERDAWES